MLVNVRLFYSQKNKIMKQNQNTLHSEQVVFNGKAFFMDLKEAANGRSYLVLTQSKPIEDEKYEKTKMLLFEEEILEFSTALNKLLENFKPKEGKEAKDAYVAKIRETYPMAFQPWTKEEEELLITLFNEGKTNTDLVKALQRREAAITARLSKLGLIEKASAA